jgi:hypothetical protein
LGETSFPYRKDHRSIAGVAALSLRCGETYTAYLGRTENNSVE